MNASESWKEIIEAIESENKEFIEKWKSNIFRIYLDTVNQILGSELNESGNSDIFVWTQHGIELFLVEVNDDNQYASVLPFIKSVKHAYPGALKVSYRDLKQETSDYFIKKKNFKDKILYLIENNFLDVNLNDILSSSFDIFITQRAFPKLYFEEFADREFNQANKSLSNKLITSSSSFNNIRIHASTYKFEEMLKIIDNQQFEIELSECLEAYSREMFYVCAAGLGGILEHLMYLTIEKHGLLDKQFPDNATLQNYIGYFTKPPLSIDKRQKTHIKNIFNIRNSISHFNQGFTAKNQCVMLMDGVKDIFINYYNKDFSN